MQREKYTIDATDKSVGRLAVKIATLLRGKNRPEFEPHIDGGGIVEVNNVSKIRFSGKKWDQKKYYNYSGYPGGIRERKASELREDKTDEILTMAVRNMLPANKLRKPMLKRLIIRK